MTLEGILLTPIILLTVGLFIHMTVLHQRVKQTAWEEERDARWHRDHPNS